MTIRMVECLALVRPCALQERARIAEQEIKEARRAEERRRAEYRSLLQQQMR
jgi:hypothetical protein